MLGLLRQVSERMNEASSVENALDNLVVEVCQGMEADACALYIYNAPLQRYDLMSVTYVNGATQAKHYHIREGEGLVSVIAEQRRPLSLNKVIAHPQYIDVQHPDNRQSFDAFLGVPIIHRSKLYGVLLVQRITQRPFTDNDESFLVTLGAQVAATVAHAIDTGRLSQQMDEADNGAAAFSITGIPAVSGVAIGQAVIAHPPADFSTLTERLSEDVEQDLLLFDEAVAAVSRDIQHMSQHLSEQLGQEERALFTAYEHMLDSARFKEAVIKRVKRGEWVQSALKAVVRQNVQAFESMTDAYLSERAHDVRDLGRRLLAYLQKQEKKTVQYPPDTILIGAEVTPSMLAEVPQGRLKAIVSARGSGNAHVAILANALGVPTVMGAESLPLQYMDDALVIVDGYAGKVFVRPHEALRSAYRHLVAEEHELQVQLETLKPLPAETKDACAVALMANIGLVSDTNMALAVGCDGVGLYRSEVPFMMREHFPSEDEQRVIYRQVLKAFSGRPVTMRTLDVGGDKPLSYFPIEDENPFLGWRGIRISLDHPELFQGQVRAMMRAGEQSQHLRIMLPMVTSLSEIQTAKQLIIEAYEALLAEGVVVIMPKLGIMLEVPAILYQLDSVLTEVDFVSVGSNDLTQYLLAVDRGNARVSKYYDHYHPAVLRVLHQIARAADAQNVPVTICGEMAGDPLATMLLIGMGYMGLSMTAASVLRVKWILRAFTVLECQQIVSMILAFTTPDQVREFLSKQLIDAGLGGVIRAGKF